MRNEKIDLLRFFGLVMIILAHINPVPIVFQLRNFDVPLMVLVSGFSFALTYNGIESGYFVKRLKRLVLPTWIFLSVYFIAKVAFGESINFSIVIQSYIFSGGIGYVWVIQVFLVIALLSPFVYDASTKIKSDSLFFVIVFISYLVFEFLYRLMSSSFSSKYSFYIINYLIMPMPYILIFSVGARFFKEERRFWQAGSIIFALVFIFCASYLYMTEGRFVPTQVYKYPPRMYYISYALLVSFLLVSVTPFLQKIISGIGLAEFVLFCSKNSIWIYLWHIVFVGYDAQNVAIKYFVVLFVSVLVVYFQVNIVNRLAKSSLLSERAGKNLISVFTG